MNPASVGLTESEYASIVAQLGRQPNDLELGLFGVLWSEHCSYKSSKNLLAWLPHGGPFVVQGPGENAGVVRLNDQWDVAFKVESHNHPSFVEPVQGAATGVGGIIRDIVAMGARPVALADSLRFGTDELAARLQNGVVEGIGAYGNAIGIPTVTGEVGYGAVYNRNPLVNALCVGLRRAGVAIGAGGARPGSEIYLIGQHTGRDGIHGASLLASQDFGAESEHMRPTVQVGDPFMGKLLMEATLAAVDSGLLDAVQDLGAAGLTSAVAELCYRSGVGATLWLDRVPCRETGMTPYEVMLSETQERMVLVVAPEHAPDIRRIVEHFEVPMTAVGTITAADTLSIQFHGEVVAEVPPTVLAGGCPRTALAADGHEWATEPVPMAETSPLLEEAFDPGWGPAVLGSPDCRDRSPIYQRYDWTIQTNTTRGPAHDVAVLRVRGSADGMAISVAGPGRWAAVDAYAGGAGAVSRVVGRLAAEGAIPLGLTDGINAGNPTRPDVFSQLAALIAGIADAARILEVAVTGGNVSLHNETDGHPIWPTAVIGGVGRHPRPLDPGADEAKRAGDLIYLYNPPAVPQLGGSVFALFRGALGAYPRPDLPADRRAYALLRDLRQTDGGPVRAARMIGDGGLFVTAVKLLLHGDGLGLSLTLPGGSVADWLFNEMSGQSLLVVEPGRGGELEAACREQGVPVMQLGEVTADDLLTVGGRYRWELSELRRAFQTGQGR